MVALQRKLQEEDVQEFQCIEETKTYKDEEVQVNYLVHLTG